MLISERFFYVTCHWRWTEPFCESVTLATCLINHWIDSIKLFLKYSVEVHLHTFLKSTQFKMAAPADINLSQPQNGDNWMNFTDIDPKVIVVADNHSQHIPRSLTDRAVWCNNAWQLKILSFITFFNMRWSWAKIFARKVVGNNLARYVRPLIISCSATQSCYKAQTLERFYSPQCHIKGTNLSFECTWSVGIF